MQPFATSHTDKHDALMQKESKVSDATQTAWVIFDGLNPFSEAVDQAVDKEVSDSVTDASSVFSNNEDGSQTTQDYSSSSCVDDFNLLGTLSYEEVREVFDEFGLKPPSRDTIIEIARRISLLPEGPFNPENVQGFKDAISFARDSVEKIVDNYIDFLDEAIPDSQGSVRSNDKYGVGCGCNVGGVEMTSTVFEFYEKPKPSSSFFKNLWPLGSKNKARAEQKSKPIELSRNPKDNDTKVNNSSDRGERPGETKKTTANSIGTQTKSADLTNSDFTGISVKPNHTKKQNTSKKKKASLMQHFKKLFNKKPYKGNKDSNRELSRQSSANSVVTVKTEKSSLDGSQGSGSLMKCNSLILQGEGGFEALIERPEGSAPLFVDAVKRADQEGLEVIL